MCARERDREGDGGIKFGAAFCRRLQQAHFGRYVTSGMLKIDQLRKVCEKFSCGARRRCQIKSIHDTKRTFI